MMPGERDDNERAIVGLGCLIVFAWVAFAAALLTIGVLVLIHNHLL